MEYRGTATFYPILTNFAKTFEMLIIEFFIDLDHIVLLYAPVVIDE